MQATDDSIRILHVDDDPDFADMTATFIEGEDERFITEIATSADDGLDRLRDDEFDCIISDYDIPWMNGIEFLQTVREQYPDLPFILFTGKGSEAVASEAISAGATDYLQKQSGTEQYELLANRIDNAISQARSQQAQLHLRELAENTNQILYIFDHDWSELQFINPAYEDIWGRSVETLRDDPTDFLNGIHPDDRDRVQDAMERMSGGETVRLEYRVNPTENYERWVAVRGVPIVNETGDPIRVAGLAIDITERKRQEQELERSRDLLRHTEQVAAVGGVEIDPHTKEVRWTDGARAIHGVADDYDPSVETALDFYLPADREAVRQDFERCLETGESYHGEYQIQTADGESRWMKIHSEAVRENGETKLVRGAIRDITARKQREQELRETTSQLQTVLDTVEAAIFIKDIEGRYQLMNQECRRLLGVASDEDITGLTDQDVFPADVAEQYQADDQRVIETGETIEIEEEVPTPEGTQINQTLKSPFYDEEGNVVGVCAVSTDITERKEDKQKIQRERDRLEEFAGVVSHDLRNPLRLAEGQLELARKECDSEHLETLDDALVRMNRIIEDVLWLAREGQQIGSMGPVELQTAVDAAWRVVAGAVDGGELRYAIDTQTVPKIEADDDRLQQLFENLLKNAIEHGGPDATITVGLLDEGFYVEDNGPGISPNVREEVFNAGHTTAEDGTGFGLRIVKQVAEAHGWDISVSDGSDGGTRFEIRSVEFVE